MPQFMTISHAPGLLEEQWNESAAAVYAGTHARFVQAHVNLGTGFVFTIYEAESRDAVVEQFEELGMPFDEIHELQFSQSFEEMERGLRAQGRI